MLAWTTTESNKKTRNHNSKYSGELNYAVYKSTHSASRFRLPSRLTLERLRKTNVIVEKRECRETLGGKVGREDEAEPRGEGGVMAVKE